jgi:hypothetical protein
MAINQTFMTTGINESYTITGTVAADVADVRGRGFKFDTVGNLTLASAGEVVIGVGIMTAGREAGKVNAGDTVTLQIKGMGKVYLGAEVKAGDALKTDTDGNFVKASTGEPVIGFALKAGAKDTLASVLFARG